MCNHPKLNERTHLTGQAKEQPRREISPQSIVHRPQYDLNHEGQEQFAVNSPRIKDRGKEQESGGRGIIVSGDNN